MENCLRVVLKMGFNLFVNSKRSYTHLAVKTNIRSLKIFTDETVIAKQSTHKVRRLQKTQRKTIAVVLPRDKKGAYRS